MKKENVYVEVKSKNEAEMFRTILEAMGEPISNQYYPFESSYQLRLSSCGNWILGTEDNELSKITFGELIDLLQRKPLFKTTNGVDIFKGDAFYWVSKLTNRYCNPIESFMNDHIPENDLLTFDTKESALEWIEAKKPKSVEYMSKFGIKCQSSKNEVLLDCNCGCFSLTKKDIKAIYKSMEELS